MKTTLLALVSTFLILVSCNSTKSDIKNAENIVADSFSVIGVEDMYEVLYMHGKSNKELVSFSSAYNELKKYTRSGNDQYTSVKLSADIPYAEYRSFGVIDSNKMLLVDLDNNIYFIDSNLDIRKYSVKGDMDLLQDRYRISNLKYHPILYKDSVFYATQYYLGLDDYELYFKEHPLCKYQVKDTIISIVNCFIDNPETLINNYLPFPKYCIKGDSIVLIYPCFDSLYIFNTQNETLSKVNIGNNYFTDPNKFDHSKLLSGNLDEYNSYSTQYILKNFQYQSIYYNPVTDHFILFYYKPVNIEQKHQQELNALVLDADFKSLGHYYFSKKYYSTENFCFIPGQGLAMPIFKRNLSDDKKVDYYIYNF